MNNKTSNIYPWVVVGLLWGVALLNYMDRQMLSTMRIPMMEDVRELESAANFGRLMAVFLWVYGLMSPLSGIVGDRMSRKWLIVGSLCVWSGVTYLMGYATTFNQLYWLRGIMGISEALYLRVWECYFPMSFSGLSYFISVYRAPRDGRQRTGYRLFSLTAYLLIFR